MVTTEYLGADYPLPEQIMLSGKRVFNNISQHRLALVRGPEGGIMRSTSRARIPWFSATRQIPPVRLHRPTNVLTTTTMPRLAEAFLRR